MSSKTDSNDQEYRKATENGQVTIPSQFRGEEAGYLVRKEGNEIILVPAQKEEKITIAQADD